VQDQEYKPLDVITLSTIYVPTYPAMMAIDDVNGRLGSRQRMLSEGQASSSPLSENMTRSETDRQRTYGGTLVRGRNGLFLTLRFLSYTSYVCDMIRCCMLCIIPASLFVLRTRGKNSHHFDAASSSSKRRARRCLSRRNLLLLVLSVSVSLSRTLCA